MNIYEDKLEDNNNRGEEDKLNLNDSIANGENQQDHFDLDQHVDQQKYFCANLVDNQDDLNVDNDDKDSIDNDIGRVQAFQNNNHVITKDNSISDNSLDC